MLTPDDAWREIAKHCRPISRSLRDLEMAQEHVLAEPIRADRDLPATNRSAMDGFAFRAREVGAAPTILRIAGEVAAGVEPNVKLAPGECARIFTGAALPAAADTVVTVEETRAIGEDAVEIPGPTKPGVNVLLRGEDARADALLLAPGMRLNAGRLAVCAAVGRRQVLVYDRPRIAVVTTGRELLAPAEAPRPHQIRDSNSTLLTAALKSDALPVVSRQRVSDSLEAIVEALTQALLSADAVLLSGGVSVGAYDFVPEAVRRVGCRTLVHGIAMKPGKPTLFASNDAGKVVFGLPGNPLATMTALYELALPALRKMAGTPPDDCRPLWHIGLASALSSKGGRHRYHLARIVWTDDGPLVLPLDSRSSADLVAGGRADGAIIVPPDVASVATGALVRYRPWRAPS